MIPKPLHIATAIGLCFSAPAVAQNVNVSVKTGDVTTTAQGENSNAETCIGHVDSANVKGSVNIVVVTGDVTTNGSEPLSGDGNECQQVHSQSEVKKQED